MKEPYKKGVANHLDPESCAEAGNRVGEALTGAHAGQPSSSEITSPGGRPRGPTCPLGTHRAQSRARVAVDGGAYEKSHWQQIVIDPR